MKNTNKIINNIKIDNFLNSLSRNKQNFYWKELYKKYCFVEHALNAKVFVKYTINFEFIHKIFAALKICDNEKDFIYIQNRLIIFRNLLFFFNCFKHEDNSSKFKFLNQDTLNFKYITEADLNNILIPALAYFKFYLIGITSTSHYYGVYTDSEFETELFSFNGSVTSIIDGLPYGDFMQSDFSKKSNLLIFEKAVKCEFNGIQLLNIDEIFDEDFLKKCYVYNL